MYAARRLLRREQLELDRLIKSTASPRHSKQVQRARARVEQLSADLRLSIEQHNACLFDDERAELVKLTAELANARTEYADAVKSAAALRAAVQEMHELHRTCSDEVVCAYLGCVRLAAEFTSTPSTAVDEWLRAPEQATGLRRKETAAAGTRHDAGGKAASPAAVEARRADAKKENAGAAVTATRRDDIATTASGAAADEAHRADNNVSTSSDAEQQRTENVSPDSVNNHAHDDVFAVAPNTASDDMPMTIAEQGAFYRRALAQAQADQSARDGTIPLSSVRHFVSAQYQALCEQRSAAHQERRKQEDDSRVRRQMQQEMERKSVTWVQRVTATSSLHDFELIDRRACLVLRALDTNSDFVEFNAYRAHSDRAKHLEALVANASAPPSRMVLPLVPTLSKLAAPASSARAQSPLPQDVSDKSLLDAYCDYYEFYHDDDDCDFENIIYTNVHGKIVKRPPGLTERRLQDHLAQREKRAIEAKHLQEVSAATRALDAAQRGLALAERRVVRLEEALSTSMQSESAVRAAVEQLKLLPPDCAGMSRREQHALRCNAAALENSCMRVGAELTRRTLEFKTACDQVCAKRTEVAASVLRVKNAEEHQAAAAKRADARPEHGVALSVAEFAFADAARELQRAKSRVHRIEARQAATDAKMATRDAIQGLLPTVPEQTDNKARIQAALDKTKGGDEVFSCKQRHASRYRVAAHEKRHRRTMHYKKLHDLELELLDACTAAGSAPTAQELLDARAHEEQCTRQWEACKQSFFSALALSTNARALEQCITASSAVPVAPSEEEHDACSDATAATFATINKAAPTTFAAAHDDAHHHMNKEHDACAAVASMAATNSDVDKALGHAVAAIADRVEVSVRLHASRVCVLKMPCYLSDFRSLHLLIHATSGGHARVSTVHFVFARQCQDRRHGCTADPRRRGAQQSHAPK